MLFGVEPNLWPDEVIANRERAATFENRDIEN